MRKEYMILIFTLLIVVTIGVSPGSASTVIIGNKTFTAAGQTADINLYLDSFTDGLSGYKFNISMGDTAVAEFTGITLPEWYSGNLETHGIVATNNAFIKLLDVKNEVKPGAKDLILCSLRVTATGPGKTAITLTNIQIDDEGGKMIIPSIIDGVIQVEGSAGSIEVTSTPAGAAIWIDGQDTGKVTPFTFVRGVRTYEVDVKKPCYTSPLSRSITVSPIFPTTVDFTLTSDETCTTEVTDIILPAIVIIGFLGAALLIQRTREH
jgi:hypothetical protein